MFLGLKGPSKSVATVPHNYFTPVFLVPHYLLAIGFPLTKDLRKHNDVGCLASLALHVHIYIYTYMYIYTTYNTVRIFK